MVKGGTTMTKKLFLSAMTKFGLGVVLSGLLVFVPAGTLDFWNGWLFMGVLFIPMLLAGIVMMIKSPGLLEKRLKAKETRREQSLVVKLSGLMFIVGFITAGISHRFDLLVAPRSVAVIFAVMFLLGYGMYAEVLRENAYLSRVIEVQEGQKVIDTGLYGIVRHPMYSATVSLVLAMPLILGSWISFVIFLVYPVLIGIRIKGEEEFLEQELEGYREYKQKVKWRLVPFVW